jgi:hypothetical protein
MQVLFSGNSQESETNKHSCIHKKMLQNVKVMYDELVTLKIFILLDILKTLDSITAITNKHLKNINFFSFNFYWESVLKKQIIIYSEIST